MKTIKIHVVFPKEFTDWLFREFRNMCDWNPGLIKQRGTTFIFNPYWEVKLTSKGCEISYPENSKGKFLHFTRGLAFWKRTGKFVIS